MSTKLGRCVRTLAAFLLVTYGAFCSPLDAAPREAMDNLLAGYSVASWPDADGRAFGTVYAIAQDRQGYLWIGTDAGLFRFDGSRFTPSDDINDVPLPKAAVTALCIAHDGSLLIGFADDSGVLRVRDGRVQTLSRTKGPTFVSNLAEDTMGAIWAVGDGALYRFDGSLWHEASLMAAGRHAQVTHVYVRRDGQVWAGTWLGAYRRNANGEFERMSDSAAWGLTEDADATLWMTDIAAGFRRLDMPAARQHEGSGYRLMFDRSGNLWIATYGAGLWRADVHVSDHGWIVERAGLRTGLSSDLVESVMEDRDGNIWVGTSGGLHRLTQRKLTPIENLGYVTAIAEAAQDGMWVGRTNGMVHFRREAGTWLLAEAVPPGPYVRSFYDDHRGTLWVGATEGLFRLIRGRLIPVVLPTRPVPQVRFIAPDSHGALWLGDGSWIFRWDGRRLVPLEGIPDVPELKRITYTETDKTGRLWLGFGTGRLGFLDNEGRFRLLGAAEGLAPATHAAIHAVFDAGDGALWIGGSGGLSRFKDGAVVTVTHANGLPLDQVWSIRSDVQHRLWLSVDRGLVAVDQSEFDKAVVNRSYRMQYRLYDALDGLAGGAFGRVSSARASDGTLWFVQGGGLTRLNPQDIAGDHAFATAPIYIEAVQSANERPFAPDQQTTFPNGTGQMRINYTAVMLSAANKIRFRYRLDGVDDEWVNAGTRRTALYTNLSSGSYRFRVEASSDEGNWNASSAFWRFSIRPAFFQTPLFSLLCAAAVILSVWAIWRFRLGLVQREFSLVLAERVRLSRELHDTLLQSLVGVMLQLEPIADTVVVDPPVAQHQLGRIRRQIEAYIREARESIKDLRSPLLSVRTIATALQEFGQDATANTSTRLTLTVAGAVHRLSPDVENELLRIGQEAITNAVRHAAATSIQLTLRFTQNSVTLVVSDDGIGFGQDRLGSDGESRDHYGLVTMKERAEQLGGHLRITSEAGRGTSVAATVPVSAEINRAIPA